MQRSLREKIQDIFRGPKLRERAVVPPYRCHDPLYLLSVRDLCPPQSVTFVRFAQSSWQCHPKRAAYFSPPCSWHRPRVIPPDPADYYSSPYTHSILA